MPRQKLLGMKQPQQHFLHQARIKDHWLCYFHLMVDQLLKKTEVLLLLAKDGVIVTVEGVYGVLREGVKVMGVDDVAMIQRLAVVLQPLRLQLLQLVAVVGPVLLHDVAA